MHSRADGLRTPHTYHTRLACCRTPTYSAPLHTHVTHEMVLCVCARRLKPAPNHYQPTNRPTSQQPSTTIITLYLVSCWCCWQTDRCDSRLLLVVAACLCVCRVWDLATAQCSAVLEGHTDKVTSVALSADGRTVVSGSEDRTIRCVTACCMACCLIMPAGCVGCVLKL